jgi:uncharacterized membrane protein YeaQ/YmgE (transglycosylase-associated protein family)
MSVAPGGGDQGGAGRDVPAATVNRIGLGIGIGSIVVLGVVGAVAGSTPPVWTLNLGVVFVAVAVGVLVGFLVSPYEDEAKNFGTYAKYLLAIVSGYMASKLDRAIEGAITAATTQPEVALRILIFLAVFLASLLVTFVARRYPV